MPNAHGNSGYFKFFLILYYFLAIKSDLSLGFGCYHYFRFFHLNKASLMSFRVDFKNSHRLMPETKKAKKKYDTVK